MFILLLTIRVQFPLLGQIQMTGSKNTTLRMRRKGRMALQQGITRPCRTHQSSSITVQVGSLLRSNKRPELLTMLYKGSLNHIISSRMPVLQ